MHFGCERLIFCTYHYAWTRLEDRERMRHLQSQPACACEGRRTHKHTWTNVTRATHLSHHYTLQARTQMGRVPRGRTSTEIREVSGNDGQQRTRQTQTHNHKTYIMDLREQRCCLSVGLVTARNFRGPMTRCVVHSKTSRPHHVHTQKPEHMRYAHAFAHIFSSARSHSSRERRECDDCTLRNVHIVVCLFENAARSVAAV